MSITTEAIWQELHDNLRAFIARRVSADDVDDVLQEVFLRIHRGLASVARHERLQAWVYQVARNAIVDHYRARGRTASAALDAAPAAALAEWPDDDAERTAAVRAELAGCLAPLLRQLPAAYQEAVLRADFQGEAQRAIAAELGLSVPGLKSRVQRGRARLRSLLSDCCRLEFDHRGTLVDCDADSAACCPR